MLPADYGLNPRLVHVLANPVDMDLYSPGLSPWAGHETQQNAFVSRFRSAKESRW
jgi:hypothetical protein